MGCRSLLRRLAITRLCVLGRKICNRPLLFDPGEFLRIHKSVIVAIDKINRVKRSLVGKFKVQLNNSAKSSFEIGRGFLPSVRERLNF